MVFFELGILRKHEKEIECEVSAHRMTKIKRLHILWSFLFLFWRFEDQSFKCLPFPWVCLGGQWDDPILFLIRNTWTGSEMSKVLISSSPSWIRYNLLLPWDQELGEQRILSSMVNEENSHLFFSFSPENNKLRFVWFYHQAIYWNFLFPGNTIFVAVHDILWSWLTCYNSSPKVDMLHPGAGTWGCIVCRINMQ